MFYVEHFALRLRENACISKPAQAGPSRPVAALEHRLEILGFGPRRPRRPTCHTRPETSHRGGLLAGFPLLEGDEHLPGVAAVVAAHDAVLGHVVDQPRRLPVPDAERALEQRRAAAL